MLTNLEWLKAGEKFPPKSEKERLNTYYKNRQLFECEHAEVYEQDFKRIERVIGNFSEVVSYPVILNFQKLISLKIADLLLGEPPQITSETNQKSIDDIEANSALQNTAYQVAIDVSRYGDGLFYIRKNETKGIIDIANPAIWFPIVSPDNVREIVNHVLAWKYKVTTNEQEKTFLKAQVHYKGYYEETVYLMDNDIIISISEATKTIQTGLDDFAVIQVPNVITSDRATGLDDYTDIDSIIGELMVRIGQVSRILDKHASPSMSGPSTALERDPTTGEWRLKSANYFPRDTKDDPELSYIVWEGQLASAFTQIGKLTNLLYTISEMGGALLGDDNGSTGQVDTASKLKIKMTSPLAKVNRVRMNFDPAIKRAISLCSQLGYPKVDKSDINIYWKDGIPSDELQESEIIKNRTAGSKTMSTKAVLMKYDTLTEKQADDELGIIEDEEAIPMTTPPFSDSEESGV